MSSHDVSSDFDAAIDTTKASGTPGTLPKGCPSCTRAFSQVLRPPRKLQAKAKAIIALGLCLSIVWAGLLWLGFCLLASCFDYVIIPVNVITGAIAIVVVAAPAYAVGSLAMRFPRIVTLSCRHCGWHQQYRVDAGGGIVGV